MKRFAFFRFASTKGLDRASLLNIIQVDITYKVISRFFAIGRRKKIDLRVFFFFLSFSVDEDVTSEKEEKKKKEQVLYKEAIRGSIRSIERRC